VNPSGRDCLSRFRVERCFELNEGKFSLVRCFPATGRMHQLRVHLAFCGYPVLGDKLYSGDGSEYIEWMARGATRELLDKLLLRRHALHAAKLGLPWRGNWIEWEAPLAKDLEDFVAGRKIQDTPDTIIWDRKDVY